MGRDFSWQCSSDTYEGVIRGPHLLPIRVKFLGCYWEKNFPRPPWEDGIFVEIFVGDIKLERFPSNVPSPSVLPWKSPILSSAGLELSPLSRVCAPY